MDWPTEELDQDSLASVAEDFDETVEDARLRMRFQELFAQAVDRMIELHGAGVFSERRLSGPGEPLGARIRFVADVPDGTADVLAEHQIDHLVELLGQGGLSRLEVADLQARLAEHITTNNLGTGVIGSQLDDAGIVTIEVKLSPTDPTADATSIRSSLQGQIPDGVQLDLELI